MQTFLRPEGMSPERYERLRTRAEDSGLRNLFPELAGDRLAFTKALERLDRNLGVRSCITLVGEAGAGKRAFAEAFHRNGPKRSRPFVQGNIGGAAPEPILRNLFGVESWVRDPYAPLSGLLEQTGGGVLYLAGTENAPDLVQYGLRNVLERKIYYKTGGTKTIPWTGTLVLGTTKEFDALIRSRAMRMDFYYLVSGITIRIPPLRKRKRDIPSLVEHFVERHQQDCQERVHFTRDALEVLARHDWPGNVAELEEVVKRAIPLAVGHSVDAECLLREACGLSRVH